LIKPKLFFSHGYRNITKIGPFFFSGVARLSQFHRVRLLAMRPFFFFLFRLLCICFLGREIALLAWVERFRRRV
jgi:hypothetical protein